MRMNLAGWPNEGWAVIDEVVESGPAPWRKHDSDALGVFTYKEDHPSTWAKARDLWLEGYWCFDWAAETIRVKSVDPETRHITLSKQHVYGLGSGNPAARRYRAVNLLEELDTAGEYFIDREEKALFFWPPTDLENAEIVLSLLRNPLIEVDQGLGFLAVDIQAIADRFFVVVLTLNQFTARIRAFVKLILTREVDVQKFPGERAGSATRKTLHENVKVDIHQDGGIERCPQFIQQVLKVDRLLRCTRKPIEDESLLSIRLTKALADNTQHHFVRYEVSRVHHGLCLQPEPGSRRNSLSQHIAGRYLRNILVGHQLLGLSSFT